MLTHNPAYKSVGNFLFNLKPVLSTIYKNYVKHFIEEKITGLNIIPFCLIFDHFRDLLHIEISLFAVRNMAIR